jgi:hypothetical protein
MAITLIVEDGSVVSDANTFVTISGADAYFEAYGETAWIGTDDSGTGAPTDTVKQQALLKAMKYLNNLPWKGIRYDEDQSLSWPRSNVYDRDGLLVADDTVPNVVVAAQCELALRSLPTSDVELQPDLERGGRVTAESVGQLARSFSSSAPARVVVTVVDDMLAGLLKNKRIVSVMRG